ncbi:MAG: hypothetical protein Q4G25_07515 [Paracoccus sp. (in: a-proteobacteria)]|nr:hypothetical protein [Paracoccus sp. (in: a-proteobacteria)]
MYFQQFILLLDARSFSSPWFWLVLVAVWSLAGRAVLGVPNDVLIRAERALREPGPDEPAGAVELLDWLSLQLPRRHMGGIVPVLAVGLVCFVITALAVLGFHSGLEMAQALTLLGAPLALLAGVQIWLAHRLRGVLLRGGDVRAIAAEALRRINRYRLIHMAVSVIALAGTAWWGALWLLRHPFGL